MPFELGRIEGALARQFLPAIIVGREPRADDRIAEFGLRQIPHLFAAEALVGAQRQLDRVGKAEILVDTVGERAEILHLVDDLILAAEDVRVVLRELRSEEHTSELQSLMRISYAVF